MIRKIHIAQPYCKKHKYMLKFVRIESNVEIYYCNKCHKELTEYSDISDIYWSNYEWLYILDKKEFKIE